MITKNENELISINAKDFLRQDKNFTNIDLKTKNKNQL